jgi:cation diffusion facilitator CzcD-associated flavoprotein CzcO
VIIGAGTGGIGVAITLTRAGFEDFVIVERADDIGGTWHHNRYPDLAVDIPGIVYQFSFARNPFWSRVYPKGAEIKAYLDGLVRTHRLRERLRLRTEVMARTWDEDNHLWRLALGDGSELTARYVITATGAFVEPRRSDIPGLESFGGRIVRTPAWDDDLDLTGRRVAVIGTGATAVQLIPEVARRAAHLDVYQRRAIWVGPKADLRIPGWVRWMLHRVPPAHRAAWLITSAVVEFALVGVTLYGRRFPLLTSLPKWACLALLRRQVRDPDLRRRLTPDYGFGCKRPSVSNVYYQTFTRDDVELVTEPIAEVTTSGVRTVTGRERPVDVLVLATGFELSNSPELYRERPVRGRDGFDLGEYYATRRACAYEGVSMPDLPNTFMVYGPYAWCGSSWHVMVENVARHAVRVIGEARRRGATAVNVSQAAQRRFHDFVAPRAAGSIQLDASCAGANSYYIDRHGDFSLLRPTSSSQATRASRNFPLDDYEFRTRSS